MERGEQGSLSVGIGLTTSRGTTSYLSSTYVVTDDIFEATIDDANFESVEGDEDVINILTGNLAEFPPYFNIIEP